MIKYTDICNERTLNIFSDASILPVKKNGKLDHYVGCPGIVAYKGDKLFGQEYEVIAYTTNNYCEMRAINLAVTRGDQIRFLEKDIKQINIFSDSKISVYGLREWIFKWIHNVYNNELYSTSGPVKNQDELLKIIQYIIVNQVKVKFYHVRGHHDHHTQKELIQFRNSFKNENHITDMVEDTLINFLIQGNSEVDNLTRFQLKNEYAISRAYEYAKLERPISYDFGGIIRSLDLQAYRSLIS